MSGSTTTKQMLDRARQATVPIPLYNPEALKKLAADFASWVESAFGPDYATKWLATPRTPLGSEIPREQLYTPLNLGSFDYGHQLGFPGKEPYTRGIHASMYRGQAFTMRQLCGAGSREYINRRIRMLLDHGATGVNLILDIPTIQMYDSDEPEARGLVGTVGAPVDCCDDMDVIFEGIPIESVSVSIVSHYPRNTAILLPMYLTMADRRGVRWDGLRGSVQNDFIMESAVRSAKEYIPPRDDFRIQCDNIEFLRKWVPSWNFITLNGYNLREFGTSGVTEMAVALANAIETLEEMKRRGFDVDWIAGRLAFFWSCGSDFFEEVARLRAVRRLWCRIMRVRFEAKDPRAMWMRCHVQTSGISLAREEPLNNIVRAAYHALAAVLGGAQSLHVDSYDEAYSVPSEQASLLSLRTQQILEAETAVAHVVDPLGGSFYVETLTDDIENRILDELDEIERRGGIVHLVETGWLARKVASFIAQEQAMLARGDIKVVGRNLHVADEIQMPDIAPHHHDEQLERAARERLAGYRARRGNAELDRSLEALKQACEQGRNVMAYCVDAVRAGATVGEMRRAFGEAFGSWTPPSYF